MGRDVNAFILSHDRGVPFIPVLVLIDEHAGYSSIPCNWSGAAWGIFTENSQATETRHLNGSLVPVDILHTLFEAQLFPKQGRGGVPDTWEDGQLRPTPFGELVDVGLSDTPAAVLSAYKSILLAGGDIDFSRQSDTKGTLATELAAALALAPDLKLLMQPYHVAALQQVGGFDTLNDTGQVEVLEVSASQGVAITNDRLAGLRDELLPCSVAANVSVQWQVNRVGAGWVVELTNNDGVFKAPNMTETFNASMTSAVKVRERERERERERKRERERERERGQRVFVGL
jgi:hypothetical protein